jgi:hypothetical protein
MAITTRKLYELFESKWLIMRQNPGGGSPYLQGCLLGFAGTIDIRAALDASETAELKIKVGTTPVQTRNVNFAPGNPAALTPSGAVIMLQNAGFADCTFSVDPETNRLMVKPADPSVKWIQLYGYLAGALNFGGGRYTEGKGCYLYPSWDGDLKSVAETEAWGEDLSIENDSPLGQKVTYTKAGGRTGTQIVITDRIDSRAVKQMINGGTWKTSTETEPEIYEPPVSGKDDPRRVDVFTYSTVYDKSENTEGDEVFIRERIYIGCVGHMTASGGSGSWKDSEYTLTASTYRGADGKEHASPMERDYTQSQWEALGMNDVLAGDWEGA